LHDVSGIDALTNFNPEVESPLFVAPDEEAEKWAHQMAEPFSGEVAVLKKKRNKTTGEVETSGEISEKRNVIIVDDMISTGGTIQKAITICKSFHALTITVCAVHGIFSRPVTWDKDITIITTNTVENPYMTADVTPQIAEAVTQVI
jgi:ribose-phosphate pyrophosphokinase